MLIKESLPRSQWKIGKISKFIKGRDNAIRSAEVTLPTRRCLHRALKLLNLIECPDINYTVEDDNAMTESEQKSLKDLRPTRQAALKARERLKEHFRGSVADDARDIK